MFATQIAKMKGALVTTVVGDSGIQAVKDWGADFVVDYQNEDVLNENKQYDIVIDLSGKMPFSEAKQIMKHSSAYIRTVPGPSSALFSSTCFQVRNINYLCLNPLQNTWPNLQVMQKRGLRLWSVMYILSIHLIKLTRRCQTVN